jgi:exosortase K
MTEDVDRRSATPFARMQPVGDVDSALFLLVLGGAYILKRFYSTAGADELGWALGPTAALVERFTCVHFVAERGAGFVSQGRDLVIAPACAGINFLVIAVLSLTFAFVRQLGRPAAKVCFVVACVLASYAAMLLVNATRISLGMAFERLFADLGASHGDVHRILGIATYLTSLWILFALAGAALRRLPR